MAVEQGEIITVERFLANEVQRGVMCEQVCTSKDAVFTTLLLRYL